MNISCRYCSISRANILIKHGSCAGWGRGAQKDENNQKSRVEVGPKPPKILLKLVKSARAFRSENCGYHSTIHPSQSFILIHLLIKEKFSC